MPVAVKKYEGYKYVNGEPEQAGMDIVDSLASQSACSVSTSSLQRQWPSGDTNQLAGARETLLPECFLTQRNCTNTNDSSLQQVADRWMMTTINPTL